MQQVESGADCEKAKLPARTQNNSSCNLIGYSMRAGSRLGLVQI